MARVPRTKLGRGLCPHCGDPVTYYRTASGLVAYACDAHPCDHNSFAPEKSATAQRWLSSIKTRLDLDEAAKPDRQEAPADAPPPSKPQTKNSVFALGSLYGKN